MSTRGAIGFRTNGQDKVMYNHSDSYPSWAGKQILEFIRDTDISIMEKTANQIQLVDEQSKPTETQIMQCAKYLDLTVGGKSAEDWYCLLRDTQGDLNAYVEGCPYMIDSQSFLLDSLYCEYAYIINMDTAQLEFYTGYNKFPRKAKGRYADKQLKRESGFDNNYYGAVLLRTYPLTEVQAMSDDDIATTIADMEKVSDAFYNRQERKIKRMQPSMA